MNKFKENKTIKVVKETEEVRHSGQNREKTSKIVVSKGSVNGPLFNFEIF
jgi:hypothetical protein